ncbi:hypothetical protein RHMOL_Rhmol03G0187400 [Rhododendron molle]|uniref:Uncharacterized protein n=1 Tax=Rhododendron molle TaxID=49168 RepID=A0ACC0PHK3_RHOML|nr:hypothetical protein RHMOL_Rhmol03G0187400 [Rhododendron molle]
MALPHLRAQIPPTSLSPSALFLDRRTPRPNDLPLVEFLSLANQNPNPKPSPDQNPTNFVPEPLGLKMASSCNGLFCCFTFLSDTCNRTYYMYNPTTKQFKRLPKPGCGGVLKPFVCGTHLAFDPSKSRHYKILCVRYLDPALEPRPRKPELGFEWYKAEVYSSESGDWVLSGEPFEASHDTYFNRGVFWKGSIHWVNSDRWGKDSFRFDIEEEMIREMKMPRVQKSGSREKRNVCYFGESQGHLHIIEIYDQKCATFDVHEMEMDYSGWFVKYQVDLDSIPVAIEEMNLGCNFVPLLVVQGDINEESFLVLLINGKVIRYDFKGKTFKKLCDFGSGKWYNGNYVDGLPRYGGWLSTFPFIESFSQL